MSKKQANIQPVKITYQGRRADGQPLMPGNIFMTSSGRTTSAFPKQIAAKYHSQWLIDNAIAEARARGDDFNEVIFRGVRLLKNGHLTEADGDTLNEYLFGYQPQVVPKIFRSLEPRRENASSPALGAANDLSPW